MRMEQHKASWLKYEARVVEKTGTSDSREHELKLAAPQLELENTIMHKEELKLEQLKAQLELQKLMQGQGQSQ